MTKNLVNIVHQTVAEFCNQKATEEQRGYAQAAWFKANGKEQIEGKLSEARFVDWLQKAKDLGYGEDEIIAIPYISTHNVWHSWVSFRVEIPIYGRYLYNFDKIKFPANSELPKSFIVPFLEREEREEKQRIIEQEAREAQARAEKEAKEAEKTTWIAAHGSDYLKDAASLGYNCQRQYVTERAALEFPDFAADFDNNIKWNDRACPSPETLAEVKALVEAGYNALVVWLTDDGKGREYDDENWEEFEPCEAIVIRDYLGKYDLIKF